MSEKITLAAAPRATVGKQNKALRRDGRTPVVLYGRHIEPLALSVDTRELVKVLSRAGGTHLVTMDVAGERGTRLALAKDVQRHVTRRTPLHVDFVQVQMDEAVTVEMPLTFEGQPELVHSGEAMVDTLMDRLAITALPGDLPAALRVDLGALVEMHDVIRAGDVTLPAKVKLAGDPELLVVHLTSTAAAAAAAAAMEAAAEAATEGAEEPAAAVEPAEAETAEVDED
jgi:large subunit ribosomal protein L25